MKNKKLVNRMFLSVATLALATATLSTTTYAWFTSNSVVDATGITGSVTSGSNSNLMISKDAKNWSTSAAFNLEGSKDAMQALTYTYDASGKFVSMGANGEKTAGVLIANATGYMTASIYLRNAGTGSVTVQVAQYTEGKCLFVNKTPGGVDWVPTVSINENTIEKEANSNYTDITNPFVLTAGTSYGKLDCVDALRVVYQTNENKTFDASNLDTLKDTIDKAGANPASANAYTVLSAVRTTEAYDTNDGLKYFRLMQKSLSTEGIAAIKATKEAKYDPIYGQDIVTLGGNECTKVTFYFYFDGNDQSCFDAILSQGFTGQLQFKAKEQSSSTSQG